MIFQSKMMYQFALAAALVSPLTVLAMAVGVGILASIPHKTNRKVTHEDIKESLTSIRDVFFENFDEEKKKSRVDDEKKGGDDTKQD